MPIEMVYGVQTSSIHVILRSSLRQYLASMGSRQFIHPDLSFVPRVPVPKPVWNRSQRRLSGLVPSWVAVHISQYDCPHDWGTKVVVFKEPQKHEKSAREHRVTWNEHRLRPRFGQRTGSCFVLIAKQACLLGGCAQMFWTTWSAFAVNVLEYLRCHIKYQKERCGLKTCSTVWPWARTKARNQLQLQ